MKNSIQVNQCKFGLNFLAIGFCLVSAIGCKEYTVLPADLVPPVDNISTFQDLSQPIITNNIYQDSLVTGGIYNTVRVANNSTFYHAIGCIENDPIFGETWAAAHVEVVPPVSNFAFRTQLTNTNRIIDSVVLSIPYISMFGDSLNSDPQTFNVYRSLQKLSRDEAQFEFTKDVFNPSQVLGTQTVDFKTFRVDSPMVGTAKAAPQLRFKLNQVFVDSLAAQVDSGANGAAATPAKFLDWCNGFLIQNPSKKGSALGYFNTYGTRLNIYYRYTTTAGLQDTVVDVFGYDPNTCNRYNNITRDYSQSVASKFINTRNQNGDSVLFVQNEPGSAVFMRFPTLASLENVIVNKAELIFTKVTPFPFDFTNLYGAMPRMQILKSSDEGVDALPKDYSIFSSAVVDGKMQQNVISGVLYTQYKFNLTNSFQKAISQKDTTFRLKIMGENSTIAFPASYRVVLRGNASLASDLKPTLNLIYTKLK